MARRIERGLFFLLFLVHLLHRLALFGDFSYPISDFLATREMAQAFLHLEVPPNFRSAPLYPLLCALTSRLLPVAVTREPIELAAEILNFCFFFGAVWMIYRIASDLLRWGALLLLLRFLVHPMISGELLGQPLIEDFLLFTTVGVCYGVVRRREGLAWGFSTAAAVSRYEGAFLIPLLALRRLLGGGRWGRTIGYTLLCAAPLLSWLVAARMLSGGLPSYAADVLSGAGSVWNFPKVLLFSLLRFLPQDLFELRSFEGMTRIEIHFVEGWGALLFTVAALLYGAAFLAGAWRLLRTRFRDILPIFGYLAGYCAIHALYPFTLEKHVAPVLWIFDLAALEGLAWGIGALGRWSGVPRRLPWIGVILLAAGAYAIAPSRSFHEGRHEALPLLLEGKGGGKGRIDLLYFTRHASPGGNDASGATEAHLPAGPHTGRPDDSPCDAGGGGRGVATRVLTDPDGYYESAGGFAYRFEVPPLLTPDRPGAPTASRLILYEGDHPLGPPHAPHEAIREVGGGRFSHWCDERGETRLLFSTSDRSNPNLNGRRYTIGNLLVVASEVRLPLPETRSGRIASLRFTAHRGRGGEAPRFRFTLHIPGSPPRSRVFPIEAYDPEVLQWDVPFSTESAPEFPEGGGGCLEITWLNPETSGEGLIAGVEATTRKVPIWQRLYWADLTVGLLALLSLGLLFPRPIVLLAICLFPLALREQLHAAREKHEVFRYALAQYAEVGRWYRRAVRPGDVLLSRFVWIPRHASGLPMPYFDGGLQGYPEGREAFVEELCRRGVTLVAWNSGPLDFPWNKARLLAFLADGKDHPPHFRFLVHLEAGPHTANVYAFRRETCRNRPPLPPTAPIFPAEGGEVPRAGPFHLSWHPARDPDGDPILDYHLQLCRDAACRQLAVFWGNRTVAKRGEKISPVPTSLGVPPEIVERLPQGTLYWRVRARDEGGWGRWSRSWPFRH